MKLSIVETSRSIWWNNVSGLYIYIISMRRSGQLWKTKLSRMAVKDLAHGETKGFIFLCVSPFLCVLQQIIAEWLCRAPAVIHHRSAHPNIHSLRKEKCGFWHQPVTRGTVQMVKGQRAAVTKPNSAICLRNLWISVKGWQKVCLCFPTFCSFSLSAVCESLGQMLDKQMYSNGVTKASTWLQEGSSTRSRTT